MLFLVHTTGLGAPGIYNIRNTRQFVALALQLGLIQTRMTQKPMLRVEVGKSGVL
jgi:hypothetical protein